MTQSNNDSKWGYWRWSGLGLVVALAYSMLSLGSPAITADKFAENRPGGAVETPLPFHSKKAMEHIKTICNLGPRISGSEAMKRGNQIGHGYIAFFASCPGSKFLTNDLGATFLKMGAKQILLLFHRLGPADSRS